MATLPGLAGTTDAAVHEVFLQVEPHDRHGIVILLTQDFKPISRTSIEPSRVEA
ncbi:hypothetical protein IWX65_003475 [Arthrobacter sp. CAN_A214]|uniref:hypothetical protein n=1 Tax=Arthrobacter sp. CAN_A214 TaxID=2787720 RepID=UPI0018CBDB17